GRVHAAGAERGLDRAGAAGNRDRRRLPARPGATGAASGGAGGCLRRTLRAWHWGLVRPDRRGLERDPLRATTEQGARDARLPRGSAEGRADAIRIQAGTEADAPGTGGAGGAAGEDAGAGGRAGRWGLHELPAAGRAAKGGRAAGGSARGLRAALPLLLPPR